VLKYIANENKRFPVFVIHRVNEIRLNSNISDWHFIPGSMNPADQCTRPVTLAKFKKQSNYLTGPLFLTKPLDDILEQSKLDLESTEIQETLEIVNINSNNVSKKIFDWSRYSEWQKLLRRYCCFEIIC